MNTEQRGLLPTKLHPRQARAQSLARPRLNEAFERCAQLPLSVISGPAGAGKSTAAVAWIAATELEVVWVSLDAVDDQPNRFFAYVVAALGAKSAIDLDALELLGAPELGDAGELEELLADEIVIPLVARERPLVLVLDDYHSIRDPRIHAGIDWLLEHGPACLRLMLLTRSQPPLALARARARACLAELGPAELYFDLDESRRFFNLLLGLELDAERVASLHEGIEGWPAGTQLAGLSLARAGGRETAPEGRDRFIAEYLLGEVLAGLEPELREFLVESAVLERVCAPLGAAVSADEGARARLAEVEAANLFLIPLDGHGRWFRYHHLFRDFLRAQAEARGPEWLALRHRRAAAWFAERGLREEAFEHAIAAVDEALILALFERWAGELLMRNHTGELRRWLTMIPRELFEREVIFAFIEGWCDVVGGQLRAGLAKLERAESLHVPGQGSPIVDMLILGLGMMLRVAALLRMGRYDEALALSAAGQAGLDADADPQQGLAVGGYRMHDALVHLERGELDAAEGALVEAERLTRSSGGVAVRTLAHYAELHRRCGRLDEAERFARRGLRLAEDGGGADPASAGLARVELGWVWLERGDPAAALREVEAGIERLRLLRDVAYLAHATELLARAHAALDQGDEALEALEASLVLLERTDMEPAIVRTQALRRSLLDASRERARAQAGAGAGPPLSVRVAARDAGLEPLTPRELEVLTLMGTGLSNRELAKRLHVSVGTIKTHVHRILRKLGVANRTRAVHEARSVGLLDPS